KQAETFAAIREAWDIPRDENLKLRDYPTLGHAIGFVRERRPDLAAPAAAPAATPAAAAAPETAAATTSDDDPIAARVVAIVSEKTGYPADMLDLDLDLEADLGIDTVKQAETFAAIREAWDIPRDENLKLRDYPTLGHAIGFVREKRPDLAGAGASPTPSAETAPTASVAAAPAAATLLRGDDEAAANVARRVPVPVLRPALDLCKETGVELGSGTRVAVMPDRGGVAQALVRRLEKRGVEVLLFEGDADAAGVERCFASWRDAGPVQGLFWLPALDTEPPLEELDLAAWHSALALRVKGLYTATRTLGDGFGGPGTFLVSGTRLGGRHGADAQGATAPMGGAVAGFTKAYKRERGDCLVKVIDFPVTRKTAELADLLLDEVLRDPGAVEIGHADGERFTLALEEQERPGDGLELGGESIFVVTGAAGGIVSAITADLASASGGTFHLLDLVPEPDPADSDIARFRDDREGLQRELMERLRARGERGTPVQVARELGGIERAHAALSALEAVRAAGGEAVWHAVDLTDGEAVGKAVEDIRERHGRVDVLLHAAGLERSRSLADKPPEEFELVFDVKADGWFNLLRALHDVPLGATVVFSSIAGRFGNAGQVDYSAANDLLCKWTSHLRSARPDTHAIAIDWTAWGDLGMATRGSIPDLMARAGIDMLPAAAGVPIVRQELVNGARGEVVIAGALGILMHEWDEHGGLEPAALSGRAQGPMLGETLSLGVHTGLHVRTGLEPARQPFLDHHRIDGTPVLPGVMGLEGFVESAALLLPEWNPVALEDVAFLAPFKFYRDEPRELELLARFAEAGDERVAQCTLVGRRLLPGQETAQETTHFRARVCLARDVPEAATLPVPEEPAGPRVEAADIYRVYFHGPAYQVLDAAWRDGERVVGRMATTLPPNHAPEELPLLAAPRLVELCFQTAGIFEIGTTGRLGLPQRIDRVALFPAAAAPAGPVHALVTPLGDGRFDATVIDGVGNTCVELAGYATAALPAPLEEGLVAPLRGVFS
ncbi:MAG: SDR family NAD(P)-dependent oxidoreductase, partial [Myxococcota bacterium]|nr:SDR family NAD(P)-dependent oxidoreductase [Myxococcota bacterium]